MFKTIYDLHYHLTVKIDQIIKECIPHDWDEDYISRSILREVFRKLEVTKVGVSDDAQNFHVTWEAYKLTKKCSLEQKFGDIGIFVRRQFADGTIIEGAGFLEAKILYTKSEHFGALKDEQLERIQKQAPTAQLLLYDFEPISPPFPHCSWLFGPLETYSAVLPISVARTIKRADRSLYGPAQSFACQLIWRFFQGLDLEFCPEILNILRQGLADKGCPAVMIFAGVADGNIQPELPLFDKEAYSDNFSDEDDDKPNPAPGS